MAAALAGLTVRPDLVVLGHSHRELRDSVIAGVHFVQPRPFGGSVSITHVDLVRDGERWKPVRIRGELASTARTAPSTRLTQRLAESHAAVLHWTGLVLGEATGPMSAAGARSEPTPILNFVNAVQLERTGADLSAASAFDLRAGFDSGTIRMRQRVALYPFDNLCARCVSAGRTQGFPEHRASTIGPTVSDGSRSTTACPSTTSTSLPRAL